MVSRVRVHFIHGLEGSPHGHKAQFLAAHFETHTPCMDTADFPGCVALHACALAARPADVLVGSSFGGAVALALLQRGCYAGPTLLLAPAAHRLGMPLTIPAHVPVLIVHGTRDEMIDIDDSRVLARSCGSERVRLLEVDDGHGLSSLVSDGSLAQLVEQLSGSGV